MLIVPEVGYNEGYIKEHGGLAPRLGRKRSHYWLLLEPAVKTIISLRKDRRKSEQQSMDKSVWTKVFRL